MHHLNTKTCSTLLKEYRLSGACVKSSKKLIFSPIEKGYDVYNITAPFRWKGETLLAGRVEKRDSEDSQVVFFYQQGDCWIRKENILPLHLQDPFVTLVEGNLIVGGVETFPHPQNPKELGWRTVFYKWYCKGDMEYLSCGPDGMKDIRLLQLPNHKILVFTRPQGEKGGLGKIGFVILDSLNDLTSDTISQAPLLPSFFIDTEWGGVNEIHLLKNGKVGCLSHIACFDDEKNRHYYSSVFCMDYNSKQCSEMKIIACRSDLPLGESKRPDLTDVLFSGGLIRNEDKTASLFCGVSDAEAYQIEIPDPFLIYENL